MRVPDGAAPGAAQRGHPSRRPHGARLPDSLTGGTGAGLCHNRLAAAAGQRMRTDHWGHGPDVLDVLDSTAFQACQPTALPVAVGGCQGSHDDHACDSCSRLVPSHLAAAAGEGDVVKGAG